MRFLFLSCLCLTFVWCFSAQAKETLVGPVNAEVLRVLDGDTLDVRVTIWLGQKLETRVRLSDIDTPELRGKCQFEKDLAVQAKQALSDYVSNGFITLKNITTGKYAGRVLAIAETPEGQNISQLLIQKGLGRPYRGQKRVSWCN